MLAKHQSWKADVKQKCTARFNNVSENEWNFFYLCISKSGCLNQLNLIAFTRDKRLEKYVKL